MSVEAIVLVVVITALATFLYFALRMVYRWCKEDAEWAEYDAAWRKYDVAYHEWVTNGRVGRMPKSEDEFK